MIESTVGKRIAGKLLQPVTLAHLFANSRRRLSRALPIEFDANIDQFESLTFRPPRVIRFAKTVEATKLMRRQRPGARTHDRRDRKSEPLRIPVKALNYDLIQ